MKVSKDAPIDAIAASYIATLVLMPIIDRRLAAIAQKQLADPSANLTGTDYNIMHDFQTSMKQLAEWRFELEEHGYSRDDLKGVAELYIARHEGRSDFANVLKERAARQQAQAANGNTSDSRDPLHAAAAADIPASLLPAGAVKLKDVDASCRAPEASAGSEKRADEKHAAEERADSENAEKQPAQPRPAVRKPEAHMKQRARTPDEMQRDYVRKRLEALRKREAQAVA